MMSSICRSMVLAALVAGCGRQDETAQIDVSPFNSGDASPETAESSAVQQTIATNGIESVGRQASPVVSPLSPDEKKLNLAKNALDDGDIFESMKLARGLIDSKDPFVRSELVEIFRWVGKKAMPELMELARDNDEGVSSAAVAAWEFVLNEVVHDSVKATAITNMVCKLDKPLVIDAVLMHIISIDVQYSLPALEGLAMNRPGTVQAQCAKRMFEHIAGEPLASPERTKAIIKEKGE